MAQMRRLLISHIRVIPGRSAQRTDLHDFLMNLGGSWTPIKRTCTQSERRVNSTVIASRFVSPPAQVVELRRPVAGPAIAPTTKGKLQDSVCLMSYYPIS